MTTLVFKTTKNLFINFCFILTTTSYFVACDTSQNTSISDQDNSDKDDGLITNVDMFDSDSNSQPDVMSDIINQPNLLELFSTGDPTLARFSKGCFRLKLINQAREVYWLSGLETPTISTDESSAIPLYFQATALGEYLLYNPDQNYLTWTEQAFAWQSELDDIPSGYSNGEWALQTTSLSNEFSLVFQKEVKALSFVSDSLGLSLQSDEVFSVELIEVDGCSTHPELSIDAQGVVEKFTFEDGDLFGIVDTHSHIVSNLGFGSGVHGSAFHRLGVAHALKSCTENHGEDGRLDLWGYFADQASTNDINLLTQSLLTGRTPVFNHHTDGYPEFTDWPNAPYSSTHQTQYYRWIERAWLGGLRLIVQHAVANQVICELQSAKHPLSDQYECDEMVNVRRSIDSIYEMERYIDAQYGGLGKGFFRIVKSSDEARTVIAQGKLAIVLGIETSKLFNCSHTVIPERPSCTPEKVTNELDRLYELGIRVLFPVHKYDNAFSAGDGARGVLEIANLINGGHYSSFVDDCDIAAPNLADHGSVTFGGLNRPREVFGGEAPIDISAFADNPIATLAPLIPALSSEPLEGNYCRNHGLTDLGRHLIEEMMARGMLIEMDHFSRRAYAEVFTRLEEAGYPAIGSHGHNFNGKIYEIGGVSKVRFQRCQREGQPGYIAHELAERVVDLNQAGAYPAEGFGFDLNGFASYPKPRFGVNSPCRDPQTSPITYPFSSYAGDVSFTEPVIAERSLDFNNEGLVHLGLFPELIEDLRRGGASDQDLEPLFRSAEGYLRMWRRAERWAASR